MATASVPGQRADAPGSIPAMARVRERVGRRGRLSVGDGQMGALATRAVLQAGGAPSRGPLAAGQLPPAVLERSLPPVWTGAQPWTRMTRVTPAGNRASSAAGYARVERLTAAGAEAARTWTARRRVVRSRQLARAGAPARRARLATARAAVTALHDRGRGQPRFTALPARPAAVETSVTRSRGHGRWAVQDPARVWQRPRRRDGRRPAPVRVARDRGVKAVVDRPAVATAIARRGWRVDATNAPRAPRSRSPAGLASRSQDRVARDMGRLQGHPLSLTPRSLAREDHVTGLIRRLSVGWRVLTRLACVVRQRLAAQRTVLAGRSAGTPTRATARPTTERLLERFEGLTLTLIREGRRRRDHLTPLSRVQRRILTLLNVPVDISTRLCPDAHKPPSK